MLTEEQKQKAEEALLLQLPMFQDFEKEIAFRNHQEAIEWIDKYNLPYRIALNYIKGYDNTKGYVQINACYPAPGYCKDDLIHLSPDDINIDYQLNITPKDEATRQQIKECCDRLRPWNLSTAAGLEQWKRYFAHFLNAADIDSYNSFDWFGVKVAAYSQEQNNKINFWKCLHADYYLRQGDFMQEEPLQADYDLDQYTTLEFVVDWNSSPNNAM